MTRKRWTIAPTRTARIANATAIRLMTSITASPKARVIPSTPRLNQAKNPFFGGAPCRRRTPHIAGVRVSATNPETATEMTIVMANCL